MRGRRMRRRRWGKRRGGGGGDALGRDASFLCSRALTDPLRCNRTHHMVIRGREVMPFIYGGNLGFHALIWIS